MGTLGAVVGLAVALSAAPAGAGQPDGQPDAAELLVYVGTYTREASEGIYVMRLHPETGRLTEPVLAAETDNPSFLAVHPRHRVLYAVNEVSGTDAQPGGRVSAFAIGEGGGLTLMSQQSSEGAGPCYVAVDREGGHVLVANYGGGSVAVLPLDGDGDLGRASSLVEHVGSSVDPKRQQQPHAHSINSDPSGRFAVAADLGTDRVIVYRFDGEAGTLGPHEPPGALVGPGAGPRHLAFHPNGRFAYVINELSSTVTLFGWDAEAGTLDEHQTISALPDGFSGSSFTAEVQVHPSGRFVYGSNRGHDSLAVFAVDEATGRLTLVGHEPTGGEWPRHFGIDPTGTYLLAANQHSGSIVVFRIDQTTGRLTATGQQVAVADAACVRFVPS